MCCCPRRGAYPRHCASPPRHHSSTTVLVCCPARVDLFCLRNGQTWVALLGSTFPLLAQEVFELVHQLLRVEVVITAWARRCLTRRVIRLLELLHTGLGRGVLGHRLVAASPKGRTAASRGETSSSRSSRRATTVSRAWCIAGFVVLWR